MSVQATWNLDYTVGAALNVGMGILRAASRDNVQPLAILACEKFGNTIAMCQDTCRKVERAMMTPEAVPVAFLRATVGFFADDCGSQLSKSLAGVQFLGLATALVTSMGPYESGNVLELLLKNSTSDRTLLPTARQLKDLLAAIEPRCNTCGFADSVVGWRLFLCGQDLLVNVASSWEANGTTSNHRPSDEGIGSFVDGLRQIARIGNVEKCTLSVMTTLCAPWAIAFTKWCLGSPPTVIFKDNRTETTILDSPRSPVFLIIGTYYRQTDGFRLSVSSSLKSIADIVVHAEKSSNWPLLTTIETYGKARLLETGFGSGTAYRALGQALPYCVQQVVRNLRFKYKRHTSGHYDNRGSRHPHFTKSYLNPFPRDQDIFALAYRMLGIEGLAESNSFEQGLGISDLPNVKLYLEQLASECSCLDCESRLQRSISLYRSCLRSNVFHGLGSIIADVMALSLFSHSDSLLVRKEAFRVSRDEELAGVITNAFEGKALVCDISEVLRTALCLVGHFSREDNSDTQDRWIMSSKRGQTV